jgi:hypothetical protein
MFAAETTPFNFSENLRKLERMHPEDDWKGGLKGTEEAGPDSIRSAEAYIDPVKRMQQFYSRGSAQAGKTFVRSAPSSPAVGMSSPGRVASPVGPNPIKSKPRPMVQHTRRSQMQKPVAHRGGYMSPNMIAFKAAEENRLKKKAKSGSSSIGTSTPTSRRSPTSPPRKAQAHSPLPPGSPQHETTYFPLTSPRALNPRTSTPGTRIPTPSRLGTDSPKGFKYTSRVPLVAVAPSRLQAPRGFTMLAAPKGSLAVAAQLIATNPQASNSWTTQTERADTVML